MPDSISRRDFGDWLGERRKVGLRGHKITQGQLADAVGVEPPYISQLENSQRRPSYGLIVTIANYFGEDADPLLRMAGYDPQEDATSPNVLNEVVQNPTLLRFVMQLVKLTPDQLRKLIKIAEVLGHGEGVSDTEAINSARQSQNRKKPK